MNLGSLSGGDAQLDAILGHLLEAHEPRTVRTCQNFIDGLPKADPATEGDCSICMDAFDRSTLQLPCGHAFHKRCLLPWLAGHNTCPSCRHLLPEQPRSSGRTGGEHRSGGSSGSESPPGASDGSSHYSSSEGADESQPLLQPRHSVSGLSLADSEAPGSSPPDSGCATSCTDEEEEGAAGDVSSLQEMGCWREELGAAAVADEDASLERVHRDCASDGRDPDDGLSDRSIDAAGTSDRVDPHEDAPNDDRGLRRTRRGLMTVGRAVGRLFARRR